MKKLLSILIFLCACSSSFATHTIVGTGSGSVNINGMAGRNSGDTILITAGTYTGGSGFTSLRGIVILPNTPGHTVFFTSGLGFRDMDSCEIGYVTLMTAGDMDMRAYDLTNAGNKPIKHCYLHHLSFINLPGACINANGGIQYTDSNSAEWLDVRLDSINEFQCDLLCQGSFGSPTDNTGHPPAVMLRNTITRFVSIGTTATTGQGTEIRGIMFEYVYHDWSVFDVSGRGNSGDDGLVYGHGSGTMYNIYKWGGPGYIVRMAPTREVGRPGFCNEYNICKTNSTDYGVIQHQNPDTVTAKFGAVDSINCWNITGINMASDNNYWCQVVVLGDMSCTGGVVWMYAHIHNDIGIAVTDHANGDQGHDNGTFTLRIVLNMGTGLSHTDTANNQYWQTMTLAKLDSTTTYITNSSGTFPKYIPTVVTTGNILHGGQTNPFTAVDFSGAALRTPPDLGYLQLAASGPPVANAGTDQITVLPANSVTLTGLASTGVITSYLWTQISGPNTATLGTPTNVTCPASGLIVGTYVFRLSLNGGTSTDDVSVAVQSIQANAGSDQSINQPTNTITLDGSASTSSGTITSKVWTQVSGPTVATIATPNSFITNVTGFVVGTYVYQISITDNNSNTSTDRMTLSVNPAVTPGALINMNRVKLITR